jgi:pyridoxal phosphate enzyme (YggS family)
MTVAENLAAVEARVAAACARAGRPRADVRLLPVSKTHPSPVLREAYAAGVRWFGENKVQEAAAKAADLADLADLRWSFIGHLQTNKARDVAAFAHEFQALDSLRIAEALDRRLQALGRGLDVLIEVDTSGEDTKFGVAPADVPALARALSAYPALRLRGLMTIAANTPDAAVVAGCFDRLAALRDRLRADLGDGVDELSMGMSADFELAIEHGATCVRVGTAVFGAREYAR